MQREQYILGNSGDKAARSVYIEGDTSENRPSAVGPPNPAVALSFYRQVQFRLSLSDRAKVRRRKSEAGGISRRDRVRGSKLGEKRRNYSIDGD